MNERRQEYIFETLINHSRTKHRQILITMLHIENIIICHKAVLRDAIAAVAGAFPPVLPRAALVLKYPGVVHGVHDEDQVRQLRRDLREERQVLWVKAVHLLHLPVLYFDEAGLTDLRRFLNHLLADSSFERSQVFGNPGYKFSLKLTVISLNDDEY